MALNLKPEIQDAINRWQVEIEIDPVGHSGKSVAIYGYLPTGMRILLGIAQEERRMRYVDEVIDEYLREADPVLAAALLQDVDALLGALDEIENYRFGPYGDRT